METISGKFDLFRRVTKHLLTQKQRSTSGVACRYRTTALDGRVLKCAVGALIPDECYTPEMEGKSVFYLRKDHAEALPWTPELDEFAGELQRLHDNIESKRWEQALRDFEVIRFNTTAMVSQVVKILAEEAQS